MNVLIEYLTEAKRLWYGNRLPLDKVKWERLIASVRYHFVELSKTNQENRLLLFRFTAEESAILSDADIATLLEDAFLMPCDSVFHWKEEHSRICMRVKSEDLRLLITHVINKTEKGDVNLSLLHGPDVKIQSRVVQSDDAPSNPGTRRKRFAVEEAEKMDQLTKKQKITNESIIVFIDRHIRESKWRLVSLIDLYLRWSHFLHSYSRTKTRPVSLDEFQMLFESETGKKVNKSGDYEDITVQTDVC